MYRNCNRWKHVGRLVGIFALACMLPGLGYATCQWSGAGRPTEFNFNFLPTISVGRDAVAGTVLATTTVSAGRNPNGVICNQLPTHSFRGVLPLDTPYRMSSGVPGVAFEFSIESAERSLWNSDTRGTLTRFNIAAATITLRLVKTGPVTSGVVRASQLRTSTADGLLISVMSSQRDVTIVASTCSVSTPSVTVNLDEAVKGDFSGIGTTAKEKAFNIGLNCSGVTAGVYATLTDSSTPGNRTNQLSLAAGSTATGVGLQILRAGAPISYGADSSVAGNANQFYINTAANIGVSNIPFSTRYVKTDTNVVPGTVRGIATFTMSYQ